MSTQVCSVFYLLTMNEKININDNHILVCTPYGIAGVKINFELKTKMDKNIIKKL